ncbi:MAG: hypothetical protein HGA35_05210 [Erysipelotrichaceae bacterium]|nr:hypothetical protein [Erysipelotrichaceae bacterium]
MMKRVSIQFIQWILLAGFVFSMVFVLYLGADFYQSMNNESNQSLNQRSILLYFNHRLKQADEIDGFSVQNDLLTIQHDGYYTLVYEENGFLVEQVSEVNIILESSGQKIANIRDLNYTQKDDQVIITYKDDNNSQHELQYSLKSLGVER